MAIPPPEQWHLLPKTRAEAIAQGSIHFFTGEACKHGHVTPRQTSRGKCTACHLEGSQTRRAEAIGDTNTDGFYEAQAAQIRARPSQSQEAIRARDSKSRAQRRTNSCYRVDRRPPNQSVEERKAIADFEKAVKARGNEPDHIVQFRHPQLRGLHTLANLQELTPRQNRIKGNRAEYKPDQIEDFIARGMAVRIEDVDEDTGVVNWSRYPQHE